ncbi:hypothetical protein Mtc_0971 [Methanocella conradii HZ254]|uniref:Uncharacterized protein n=1 Tax=Methanocella conradii (strain DSM 24694 / JCM 17849 / CGMCC 1.5162 / HZ254) TaxID=1041930 RepID=H8I5Q9_METCZ|nr:hypothetical protein [Methanocella conradii]AFC99726.1 hypothetical protein Mtc_0971 [Methanocella conradii HZ254]MDI6896558.1 hypothetical protein [Methanocella conradii]
MAPRENVTEADVKVTGARLAEAYAGFKKALFGIPSEAVRPVADTVKSHPYVSMAAAASAGFVAYRLLGLLMPREKTIRDAGMQPQAKVEERRRPSLTSRLISGAAAFAAPYIMSYVKGELARLFSKKPEKE